MDMNLNVLVPQHEDNDVRESAMGGKHQRSLSLSAKWASDKAMAIEYLRRQREIMAWIESVLKRELPTTDLFEALKSGVVLREMMETLFPDVSNCMSPISRNYTKRMAPWKERENISVFLRQCKSIGMYDLSLFCTDDLYEGTNMVQVLFCVQHFMMFSEEHAGHLFKPVAKNEPAEFSNQELEMAMSKLEQAGVDAKALQGLISASSSSSAPEKTATVEKESAARTPSEPSAVASMDKKLLSVKEEEPAQSEECSAEKAYVQPEVCNQVSEDKQDVVNPADDDDLNPEQESGSDAGDEQEVIQPEDSSSFEQGVLAVEAAPINASAVEDVETMAVIQQVLSDMTAAVEEAEVEAQSMAMPEIATTETEPEAPDVEAAISEEVEEKAAELATDLIAEAKTDTADQDNVEIELTEEADAPGAGSADSPAESKPDQEVGNAQASAETTDKGTERTEEKKPQQTEEEELEAKAMAKCSCRCTVM